MERRWRNSSRLLFILRVLGENLLIRISAGLSTSIMNSFEKYSSNACAGILWPIGNQPDRCC